ncbi:copper amine oxidase N-terminal domain-containing protein [Anaeromicrobium sediminis]|uniref:Copper amine oxidase-like N-terminal domain-containing protein n=1 Tax=Anaeromicrobium sediminis TaxID=1478221 RepID=A0A267MHH1_9FIRM|nr:copper amine oxidase N-terminal domain-containing protein [Anaeromicrobium sediminis]PAB58325.1 hypothetical protein CCE28_16150 [Anaeromicrobium sediminis]
MKKRAALLAMAAMLALTPVAAFASSANNVTKTVDVKDDAELHKNPPVLKIENDGNDWDSEGETIILKLDNAEWLGDVEVEYYKDKSVTTKVYTAELDLVDVLKAGNEAGIIALIDDATELNGDYSAIEFDGGTGTLVDVDKKSDTKLEIQVKNVGDEVEVRVPMYTELQGDGAAVVNVDSKSNSLTESDVTFANGGSGDTTITIDDTNDFSNVGDIETIEIEETAEGSLEVEDVEYIELELTKDFTFTTLKEEDDVKYYGTLSGDFLSSTIDITSENAKLDDESLKIFFDADEAGDDYKHITLESYSKGVGTLEFNGFKAKATNDADEGKVYVTVRSNVDEIDTTKLEMGTYSEWAMTVEADDDPTEIYNGFYEEVSKDNSLEGTSVSNDSEDHELVKLIIEEDVEGTWDADKEVTVKLPEWVKIMDVKIEGDSESYVKDASVDNNEFEFALSSDDDDRSVELTFYVSVEAGKTGDIEAEVTGRALDKEEFKVLLGKALQPVKVEAEIAKLKAGVRKQELGKITISETAEEMIKEGKIIVELDDDIEWDGEPEVKVVKGDLEINEDDIDVDDNILTITVDEESDEASVIEITDAEVTADRAIAEGSIEVEVKGDAIVRNGYIKEEEDRPEILDGVDKKSDALDEYGFFSNDEYVTLEVANVITPADDDVMAADEAKFVIGSTEYMVGEEVKVADVAPYIKDGRTMLSLKYVAEAVGVPTSNVIWNGEERSVTIMKGDRIAKVVIDSDVLLVNGTPIKMDTAAEIKSGRTMLPVSFIGKALGAEIGWDGATKTVTIK